MQDFQSPLLVVSSCGKLTWNEVGEEAALAVGATLFSSLSFFSVPRDVLPEGCPF